jgi:hypothetical protein
MLALGTGQGFVELIDPATGQTRARTKPHNFDVTALQVMWDMSAGRVARIARQNLPPSDFTDCCGRARQLSPCGRLVASGGRDGVVKVWVAENGLEQWRLQAHDGRDGCLCELFDPLSNPEEVEMATDIFSNTQELLRFVLGWLPSPCSGSAQCIARPCARLPTSSADSQESPYSPDDFEGEPECDRVRRLCPVLSLQNLPS